MSGEIAIYQAPGVWISKQRAVFGANTYAMAQVSAVSARTLKPNRAGPVLLLLGGFALLALGLFCAIGTKAGAAFVLFGGVGVLLLVGGIIWWYLQKTTYVIWLNTSGGQVQALWSHDWPYIESVHNALQYALIHRG